MLNLRKSHITASDILKYIHAPLLTNKTLIIKRNCYQCNGQGFYEYYDPILDSQGYYESSAPERAVCDRCNNGQIVLKFNSPNELKTWIEDKIKRQDWSYNYSDDFDVRRKEYFYQSLTQELLWLLPIEIAENLLNQYQNNIDKQLITIKLYTATLALGGVSKML